MTEVWKMSYSLAGGEPRYIGLAKKFIWDFHNILWKIQTFWPTQYIHIRDKMKFLAFCAYSRENILCGLALYVYVSLSIVLCCCCCC